MWQRFLLLSIIASTFYTICEANHKCPLNEIYEVCLSCPARNCGVNIAAVQCLPTPQPGDPKCTPGCRCCDGFLRNGTGNCIPENLCPTCPANEEYDVCPAPCPPQRCDIDPAVVLCAPSPSPGDPACEPGCRCQYGLVRNSEGICIPREQCPPTCKKNEVFSNCTNGGCGPWRCSDVGFPTGCVKMDQRYCTKGCMCKEGYVRNENNICIPARQCQSRCGVNEVYSKCPDAICAPQSCSELGFPQPCPNIQEKCPGPPGCVCANGFVRNRKGRCIPQAKCPSCGGDPNAVSGCGVCQKRCSDYNKGPRPCPRICLINACNCKNGFVFDDNTGKCVRPEYCSNKASVCDARKNEIWDSCANGGCQKRSCSEVALPQICKDPISCIGGCVCVEGYLRAENNACVPGDLCPESECLRENEVYNPCPSTCSPDTCDAIGKDYNCTIQLDCNPSCVCNAGFYRNSIGDCISEEDCQKCSGPNEYFSCGGACDNVCATLSKQNQTNCPIVNIVCNQMCYCKDGYARDNNNICVPIAECPNQCGENERYEECPDAVCQPKTCDEVGYFITCPDIRYPTISCAGQPGCICDNNMVRDAEGKCIPQNQCPTCGGDPNAVSGCGNNCGRLCSNYNKGPVCCTDICNENACDCKEQYVYDENIGQCVLPENCTPSCGNNEFYSTCANSGCSRRSCSELDSVCLYPSECTGGCVCQHGAVRNDNGNCIPEEDCPNAIKCDGEFEVYNSCVNRGCSKKTCTDLGLQIPCQNPSKCEQGCICNYGTLRNENGTCVPESECPIPECGANETFSTCADTYCGYRYCRQIGGPQVCVDALCSGGCICQDGYLRDDDNNCVLEENCPSHECGTNEMYSTCANSVCGWKNCTDIGTPLRCGEYLECKGGCVCQDGYLRDENNNCVPQDQCASKCGENERYEECPDAVCQPKTCDEVGYPIACPGITYPTISCAGQPGCICDNNMVRDAEGKCIPQNQCPSCGGDPNTVSGCGNNCGRLCSNYNKGPVSCTDICNENACDCREQYVYDENIGQCVLPENCTASCGNNEVYSTCANGGCSRRSCADLGILCIDPLECTGGCVCQNGAVRDDNGNCIPEEDCPNAIKCDGKNEIYNSCANSGCRKKTCTDLGLQIPCENPSKCEQGCICDYGTLRNENGTCVPESECPIPECGANETFSTCANTYCGYRYCRDLGGPMFCVDSLCSGGCVCQGGYLRDDKNNCVLEEHCPSHECGANEIYSSCSNSYCGWQKCSDIGTPQYCADTADCKGGCVCQDGYLRDSNNNCVLQEQCPCSNGTKAVIKPPPDNKRSPTKPVNVTDAQARLNKAGIILNGDFVYQLAIAQPGVSFVASASSVMIPLAQIALFAVGPVLEQLLAVLNMKNKNEIRTVFPHIKVNNEVQKDVVFDTATKYYSDVNYPLTENFINQSLTYFDAGGQNVDFSNNVEAADIINAWVAQHTRDKIQNLISPDALSADTRLVLCNAIYFLGNWINQFNPDDTETKDFYKSDTETVQIPIMYQEDTFRYAENDNLGIQALLMDYKNPNFTFLCILPKDKNGLLKTIETFRDGDVLPNIIASMQPQRVQVSFPRMEIETSIDMGKMLQEANVTKMFDPNSYGFEGILKNNVPLVVSSAVQKAMINVTETGTEAAAATAIVITTLSLPVNPPPVYVINANHSFMFFIRFMDNILFCGVFVAIIVGLTAAYYPREEIVFEATHPFMFYLLDEYNPIFCGAYFG